MPKTAMPAAPARWPTLEVEGLAVSYGSTQSPLQALRGVSFTIARGEALGLIGESGSGKSTAAYSILRHLPGRMAAATLAFRGQAIAPMSADELRRLRGGGIGMVYQDPMNALNPFYTVGSQVAEVLREHKRISRADARARVLDLFARVRLPDPTCIARRYPHQLSGGQQQRVVIAMAIACAPDLVIMDEPTTGLDVTTEAVILDLVAELRRELGVAILFISHNLPVIARVCDRVAVLYAGQVVEQGSAAQILHNPRHPYTVGLLNAMPPTDLRLQRLVSMPGSIPDLRHPPEGCIFQPRCPCAAAICATMPALAPVEAGHLSRCHFRDDLRVRAPAAAPRHTGPRVDARAAGRPRLEINGLVKRFPVGILARLLGGAKPFEAVSAATFSIEPGRTLALVGESGSGKTTLARCVAGLIPPDHGRIALDGRRLRAAVEQRERDQQQAIQFIFQNPDSSLNAYHTVREIISRPLRLFAGGSRMTIDKRVVELLETVKLGQQYLSRYPRELSGGEKQRVCIARAFAAQPTLIICDEPTSALDISVQAAILNELNELQQRYGTAYLFISHDLAVVRQMADSIAVMQHGRIVELADADQLFTNPTHPYTKALLAASRPLGPGAAGASRAGRACVPSSVAPLNE